MDYIKKYILEQMTEKKVQMLGILCRLLQRTAEKESVNNMKPRNLAAVWAPTLIRCETIQEEMKLLATSQKFIEILIEKADQLF